jgi:hypothetical protein
MAFSVAWIERKAKSRIDISAARSFPGFAELVIGPATSGRTRWLNPGYSKCCLSSLAGLIDAHA